MMTNGDPEGQIFISLLHMHNGLFSWSPLNTSFCVYPACKKMQSVVSILVTFLKKFTFLVKCRHITSPFMHALLVLSLLSLACLSLFLCCRLEGVIETLLTSVKLYELFIRE